MLEKWVGGCSGVELLLLITAGDFGVGINAYLPRSKEFDKCQSLSDGALKTVISQVHHSLKTKGDNNKNRKKNAFPPFKAYIQHTEAISVRNISRLSLGLCLEYFTKITLACYGIKERQLHLAQL